MFDFGGITHVIQNPVGTYSLVGSVPVSLHRHVYQTAADAFAAIDAVGTSCASPTCACASLKS